MANPLRILLKTTIGPVADDWNVGRFSRLAAHLAQVRGEDGAPRYAVTARDRTENADGDDIDLIEGAFDQLWLFAVDVTGALTERDVANIDAARRRGAGVLLTRDHQDLGASLARLGALGQTQQFHSVNPESDPTRHTPDDRDTTSISWPNYHSGANGDFQTIDAGASPHPIVRRASGEPIRYLPAHPHEGTVCAPRSLAGQAQVVARGKSRVTGAVFNLAVAVEEPERGRALADSSFHHLANYNWDPRLGAPSFVTEPPGDGLLRNPEAMSDTLRYVENIAAWLGERQRGA